MLNPMPSQISRGFKDISLSFTKNPITNDIISLQNEDAIKKSVINLIKTKIGERFFNSLLGSSVNNLLFELNSSVNVSFLEEEIKNLLKNYEPRIRSTVLEVDIDPDSNELIVSVRYVIIGLPLPEQNIKFILEPSRI